MAVKLRCPDCRKTFPWVTEAPHPEFCPLCGFGMVEDKGEVTAPFISFKSKRTDQVYRDMERGSEVRAQMAAEQLGVPVEEMSDLKITDLRNAAEGEAAAVPVKNEVTKIMEQAPIQGQGSPFGFNSATGIGFSSAVQGGAFANSGAKFQSHLRQAHSERAGWSAMSDNPSNEVRSPLYKRRAG